MGAVIEMKKDFIKGLLASIEDVLTQNLQEGHDNHMMTTYARYLISTLLDKEHAEAFKEWAFNKVIEKEKK